jgi:hypothetical protein
MVEDTKTLEEWELIAADLRDKVRRDPRYTEWEQEQLWFVEEWIALRRQENESHTETPALA